MNRKQPWGYGICPQQRQATAKVYTLAISLHKAMVAMEMRLHDHHDHWRGGVAVRLEGVDIEYNVPCAMRDGTVLYADIYRPSGPGPFPVLLMRQPYGKAIASTVTYAHPVWFARQGFITVIQDVRGRGVSEGEFAPFVQEVEDGYDTVEWAASLPGSNGRVGMYGFSYQGSTQWAAASARPPGLTAIAPGMCAADLYRGMFYPHGRFAIGSFLPWAYQLARDTARRKGDEEAEAWCTRMMRNPDEALHRLPLLKEDPVLAVYFPEYYEWCAHPEYDAYWARRNWLEQAVERPLPALHIGGWFDNYLIGTLQSFEALQEKREPGVFHRLVIGPWAHIPWGQRAGGERFGPDAAGDLFAEHVRWFNYWLKGQDDGLTEAPAVRYFECGGNRWVETGDMRFLDTTGTGKEYRRWYLHSRGQPANGASNAGVLTHELPSWPPETAAEPPASAAATKPPVPSDSVSPQLPRMAPPAFSPSENSSERVRAHSGMAEEPFSAETPHVDLFVYDARLPMPCHSYLPEDRSVIEDRFELLNYTSAPLEHSLRVAGTPMASIWCQVSGGPTDLVAVLTLVGKDGSSRFLSIGRADIESPNGCTRTEKWLRLDIAMWPIAAELPAGSSIRLELTGSAFPLFMRHPNGISSVHIHRAGPKNLQIATVAVALQGSCPSYVSLPVVSGNEGR
jgi:hypothetical protein